MGDVSTFTNAAYSFLNNRKKEVIMLNSIITPPPLLFCYFNKSATHTFLSGKGEPTS